MTQISYQPTVAVAGATGVQGGATARALLAAGVPVRALTRRTDSAAARDLRYAGAQVAYADFTDRASLDTALTGATALFAVTTPFPGGVAREVSDGIALLDAAAATGTVAHVVYTSAAHADRATGVPHFDSKYRLERHLATLGVPWTVIAPAAFMDQYAGRWTVDALRNGVFARPMPGDRPLALIPAADIGAFAALVLSRPADFAGRRIDIASDVLTSHQIAATLGTACGRPVTFTELPPDHVAAHSPDLAAMFHYFAAAGLDVDAPTLRATYPEIPWQTLTTWAATQPWPTLLAT